MKKFALFILLPVLFWGCEKTYDSVINPKQTNNIKVTNISPIDSVNYLTSDSVLTFAVTFNSLEQIQSVYFNVISPVGLQVNSSAISMYDDGDSTAHGDLIKGDSTFSNKFTMSNRYLNGVYFIQYYVTDIFSNTTYISAQNFIFDNGKDQFAPVIDSLVAPDTVSLSSDSTFFTIQVAVQDSNGVSDVETVFFNSFVPPDYHPSSANPIVMYDDGDSQHGDQVAGDGIYSRIIIFTGASEGSYRWEFQAVDHVGLYSNKITHYVEVVP
jgi:hypothetical protein